MGRLTRIYARSSHTEGFEIPHTDVVWYPEVSYYGDRAVPVHPDFLVRQAPWLVGLNVLTDSEYIILWFLREITEGRMEPSELELYCDGQRIRVDNDGELIDKWPGGFYRLRAALLFGEA
jgi:hypothetical protein